MKMTNADISKPSAEILNAFIDGELCSEDRLACLKQIAKEQAIGSEICDLCQVKEMVTLAYEKVPESPRHPEQRHLNRRPGRAYAAVALVLVIALAGISSLSLQPPSDPPQLGAAQTPAHAAQNNIAAVAQTHSLAESQYLGSRIVLHLTTTDANRIYNMLDEVETLMAAAHQHGIPLQIEVIANGEGLALLRQDLSPFPQRVAALAERYAGKLVFSACQNTIDRLRRDENIHVQLLASAHVINSGVAEVIRRQTQGWAYIQI